MAVKLNESRCEVEPRYPRIFTRLWSQKDSSSAKSGNRCIFLNNRSWAEKFHSVHTLHKALEKQHLEFGYTPYKHRRYNLASTWKSHQIFIIEGWFGLITWWLCLAFLCNRLYYLCYWIQYALVCNSEKALRVSGDGWRYYDSIGDW